MKNKRHTGLNTKLWPKKLDHYRLAVKMEKSVYRIQAEVEPMEGTSLPVGWSGAFVNVYIGATSIVDAINDVEKQLYSDLYNPVNTYAAYELDLVHMNDNEGDEDDGISSESIKNLTLGGFIYGAFHGYLSEKNETD